jgi:hypothetical protein
MGSQWRQALATGATALVLGSCATDAQWTEWRQHPTHFASAGHLAFSARHAGGVRPRVTAGEAESSAAEGWWGAAVSATPPASIAGRWEGTWTGMGVWAERVGRVTADLAQAEWAGAGRLVLDDTAAAEVPLALRLAGGWGVPVTALIEGNDVLLRHSATEEPFTVELVVLGDRMEGAIVSSPQPVRIVLSRVR